MNLITYSHHNNGVPCAEVYKVNETLYPSISFKDVMDWVSAKEKSLGGWGDRYLSFDGWGNLCFHYHVLKRAKVNYLDLVAELNIWAYEGCEPLEAEPLESERSHKEVCMEMFGWSKSEFNNKIKSLREE